jgi:hypothetical protein
MSRAVYVFSSVKDPCNRLTIGYRRNFCIFSGSIGDHMPPNKFVWPEGMRSKATLASQTVFMKALRNVTKSKATGHTRSGSLKAAERVAQRLFPQCTKCSEKQSLAVKLGRQVLVIHKRLGLPEVSCVEFRLMPV